MKIALLTAALVTFYFLPVEGQEKSASDAAYDAYFDRMRGYAANLEKQQYAAMLRRHSQERRMIVEKFRKYHSPSSAETWMDEVRPVGAVSPSPSTPKDPFGTKKGDLWEGKEEESTAVNPSPKGSSVPTNYQPLCERFAVSARMHCRGATTGRFAAKCWHYFHDCSPFLPEDDPLRPMAAIYKSIGQPATPTVYHPFGDSTQPSPQPATEIPPRGDTKTRDDACWRVMPTARKYCHSHATEEAFKRSCNAYLQSCSHLIASSDPLYKIAQAAVAAPSESIPPPMTAEDVAEAEREDARAKAALPPAGVEVLRKTCDRFLPTIRKHCKGAETEDKFQARCKAFFQDCQQFISAPADPLYEIAHSFDSGVGLNLGTWAVKGIPYYPINEEGAIGSGRLMNIPFGAWGGGYSDHIGVRDYWSQYQEVGANWYEGKYGYRSGFSVPLVQSLGIEGETHAVVSVPLKPGEFGKPIGVDVGGGVGPYYQQNHHVGVDWMDGQVNNNFGVGVPIGGVGVNMGTGVSFPGASTWLG